MTAREPSEVAVKIAERFAPPHPRGWPVIPAVLDALHAGDLEVRRWTDRDRYHGTLSLMDHDAAYEPDYAARADARATLARVLALREGRALVALLLAPGVRSGAERERVRRLRAKVRDAIPAGCGYMSGGA